MISSQNVSTIDAGLARLDLFLARYDREGALRDTLLVVPGFELFVHNTSKGRVVPSVLFGRGAAVTTTHEGFAVAVNDRYQIDRYDGSARLRYSVRHRAEPRAISAADMDSARAAQELLFRVPDQRPLLREAYAQMPVATTMPAIGSTLPGRYPWIVNGAAGALWVLNYQSPVEKSATWSIFDEAGVLHGTLALPNGFILHEVGVDYLLGVQRDSLDTERIVKYRLLSR
jgi:hypothetical protein